MADGQRIRRTSCKDVDVIRAPAAARDKEPGAVKVKEWVRDQVKAWGKDRLDEGAGAAPWPGDRREPAFAPNVATSRATNGDALASSRPVPSAEPRWSGHKR